MVCFYVRARRGKAGYCRSASRDERTTATATASTSTSSPSCTKCRPSPFDLIGLAYPSCGRLTPKQRVSLQQNDPCAEILIVFSQTIPNIGTSLPQLDTSQLALLQQLTQTAKLSNGSPPHPLAPPISSAPTTTAFHDTTGGPSSSRGRFDRNISPTRTRGEYYDDRPTLRGGFRGGFRGHDREDGRSRWDHRDRFRDSRERSPPYRARRSRSRSPPSRYGSRRDVKPYSPPRRPTMPLTVNDRSNSAPIAPDAEKDEFGRDIRPSSQKDDSVSSESAQTQPLPSPAAASEDPRPAAQKSNQLTISPSATWSSSPQVPDGFASSTSPSAQLDNFDATTFDFTSPSSWEALGKMWEAGYGYSPSQEALMQFVFARGMSGSVIPSSQTSTEQGWSEQGWAGPNSEGVGGQPWPGSTGRGGGTSSFGYGVTRDTREQWGHNQETDSVGLGKNLGLSANSGNTPPPGDNEINTTSVGAGGRMQRVGDKWVFVRDTPSAESK
jgi:protein NRD1